MREEHLSEDKEIAAGQFIKEKKYWLKKFSGELTLTHFPYDYPQKDPGTKDNRENLVDNITFVIDGELFTAIKKLVKDSYPKLHMVLMAGLVILLHKYTGSSDIIIATPIDKQDIEGEFTNTVLALRNRLTNSTTFKELLLQVRQTIVEAIENQNYPIEALVKQVHIEGDEKGSSLFDAALLLENIHDPSYLRNVNPGVVFSFLETEQRIQAKVDYNTAIFAKTTIERISTHLTRVLAVSLANLDQPLQSTDMLSKEEKQQLIIDFNDTHTPYPKDKPIYRLFEEQAGKTPDNPAVVFAEKEITYAELNEKKNHLAKILRKNGVTTDRVVGILLEKSIQLVAAVLGVLKAGGAYLPLDIEYPEERKKYILEDSKTGLLLTTNTLAQQLEWDGQIMDIRDIYTSPGKQESVLIKNIAAPRDLAYIIYTSGSTGRPKGVMIEHRGLTNYICWAAKNYIHDNAPAGTVAFPLYTSISFDLTVTSIFTPLITGNRIVIYGESRELLVERIIEENKVSVVKLTPTHLRLIRDKIINPHTNIKCLIVGGENFETQLAKDTQRNFGEDTEIYNEYGPTEAVVGCMIYRFNPQAHRWRSVPIGVPARNVQIYLLDNRYNPVPPGIPGEIYIAGDGVARGYLNRPELTEEKFIYFSNRSYMSYKTYISKKIYKTGDLARWLPDGNIEFLGRIDHQVKIRGNRIELGEIENKLSQHEQIKEAVVTIRENQAGENYLCAYIVLNNPTAVSGIREYLSLHLPEYMVPSYFVNLEQLPLDAHGKLDRKSLPDPEGISLQEEVEYVAPRSVIEKTLVQIWESVLAKNNIGINENFFMIGGDSIRSIQIISRLNAAGYNLEMNKLFEYPVISDLAPHVKKLGRVRDQSVITGPFPLTPIQQRFFANPGIHHPHFNQAVMFYSREGFSEEMVTAVFKKIQDHHDVLRTTYKKAGNTLQPFNRDLDYPFSLEVVDLRDQDYEQSVKKLTAKANEIQAGIDLENGPLMKLGLFHLKDGDRLLIVIHHLVVDGVSWRILFENMETLMQQCKNNQTLELPLKTDPFKLWAEKLSQYANSGEFLKEKEYWAQLEATEITPIKKDFDSTDNKISDTLTSSFILDKEQTRQMLTDVNEAFGTQINDILLTALGLGVKKTWGCERVLISQEGHGRENIIKDIDINRTIGWFTSVYPVLLDISHENHPGRQIKEIKETLRRIPNRGIGYGILKYLTAREHKQEIQFKLQPRINFNYLGQFDADVRQRSFAMAKEPTGDLQSGQDQRQFDLELSGIVTNNRLTMAITYNKHHYKAETIEQFLSHFKAQLIGIIDFCISREKPELTPSDFTYPGLSIETVDQLSREFPVQIQDLYLLTPMQEGMLFHTLYDDTPAYFEQTAYRLHGHLDMALVEKSLNELFKRHDILRTIFIYEGYDTPLQIVLKEKPCDFYHENIAGIANREEKEQFIQNFREKDKKRSFDLSKDALMRVAVIELTPREFELIWSFHHILMDGWCIGIINTEFFEVYNSLLSHREHRLPPVSPFRTYIQWLGKQDKQAAREYWKSYLESYSETAVVPRLMESTVQQEYNNRHFQVMLDRETTGALNQITAKNHVTINVITQTIWGIILGKYNGSEDVVFGAVVSGRPFELEGVESMVGLFINTIPVRIRYTPQTTFRELLQKVQQEALTSEPHHYHPLAEIQAESLLKQDLIDHIFIFENFPVAQQIQTGARKKEEKNTSKELALRLSDVNVFEQSNYDFNVVLGAAGDRLGIRFDYNANVFAPQFLEIMGNHFKQLIRQIIVDQELQIREISLLSDAEREQILYEFNNTSTPYPHDKTLHQLFAQQAEQTPDHIALVGVHETHEKHKTKNNTSHTSHLSHLTYQELDQKSRQLSQILKEKGLKPGTVAALMMERSIDMIIALLAILKAGGAYLPIDPAYPEDRINFMLKDSNAKVLLATPEVKVKAEVEEGSGQPQGLSLQVINIEKDISYSSKSAPSTLTSTSTCQVSPANLAYILYTSGSTGRPKGVMVEHGNVVRLVKNTNFISLTAGSRLLLTGTIIFDITTFEIWAPLLNGLSLYLVDQEIIMEGESLKNTIVKSRINILHLVPQLFNQLAAQETDIFSSLDYFLVGGDLVQPGYVNQIRKKFPHLNILHMYGPTENTTFSTFYPVHREFAAKIPIGKPIANSTAYVVDQAHRLQPVGVVGELLVGGSGTARGYLNNPQLTAEKFLLTSVSSVSSVAKNKIYKTGDLARWLPDGNLEFLGRRDQQIKIRGIRIELEEIERQLLNHEKIKEAVVIAQEEPTAEGKILCAYFIGETGTVEELREFMLQKLPEYMVPVYLIPLESFPLTPTGKIDRKALPHPDEIETNAPDKYRAPANELEELLVNVWQGVLGREKIGTADNFFMIGGDSIKAIQIVARVKKAGYTVTIKDIFQQHTISQLAPQLKRTTREADQSVITGIVPLTPIQAEFFATCKIHPHHFNQALMLYAKNRLDKEIIRTVFTKIQEHHDVLRMTYTREDNKPVQTAHGLDYPLEFQEHDLRGQQDAGKLLESRANEIQASLDLEKGPLMKLGLFRLDDADCLLIVIHHLVMDTVSWRILLEDIENLYRYYRDYQEGAPDVSSVLPLKTDSFKYWAEKLQEYAQSSQLLSELGYWQAVESTPTSPLPVDHEPGPDQRKIKYIQAVRVELNREETRKLLAEVHQAYNTEINDLLLSALALAIHRWTGDKNLTVSLEGHGREEIIKDMDITRTVGWFTSKFPVILRVPGTAASNDETLLSEAIKTNKEQRRAIPSRGIGYGILRYLTPADLKPGFSFTNEPEISFNYLGEFGQESTGNTGNTAPAGQPRNSAAGIFSVTDAGAELTNSLEQENQYKININSMIVKGSFVLMLAYNRHQYDKTTMETLGNYYKDYLLQIIRHCITKETTEKTLSDFSAPMDQEELEDIYESLDDLVDSSS